MSLLDDVNMCRASAIGMLPSPINSSMTYVSAQTPPQYTYSVPNNTPKLETLNKSATPSINLLSENTYVSPIYLNVSLIDLPNLNLRSISLNPFSDNTSVDDFTVTILPPLISTPSELYDIHQNLELGNYIEIILPQEPDYDRYTNLSFIDIDDNEFNNLLSELQLTFPDLNLPDISKNNFNYNIKYNSYLNYTLLKKSYLPYSEKKIIDLNDYMNDMVNIINALSPEWLLKFSKSKYDLIKHLTLKELNYDKLSFIRTLKLGLFKLKIINLSNYISSTKNLLDTIYSMNNQMLDIFSKTNSLNLEKRKAFINYIKTNENFYKNFVRIESLMREALIVYFKLLSLQIEQEVLSIRKEILDLKKMSALKEFDIAKMREPILNMKREVLLNKDRYITDYDNFLNLYFNVIKQKRDLLLTKVSTYNQILPSELSVLNAKKDALNQQIKVENLGGDYIISYNKALINLYRQYMDLIKDYNNIELSKQYLGKKNEELINLVNLNSMKLANVINSLNTSLSGYMTYLQFEEASAMLSGCVNIVNEKIMAYE